MKVIRYRFGVRGRDISYITLYAQEDVYALLKLWELLNIFNIEPGSFLCQKKMF